MIRKLLAVAVTAAALLAFAPPAQAQTVTTDPEYGPAYTVLSTTSFTSTYRHLTKRQPVRGLPAPACVTTSWRASYWHVPKTRAGAVCTWLPGMFLPRSYRLLGWWRADRAGFVTGLERSDGLLVVAR